MDMNIAMMLLSSVTTLREPVAPLVKISPAACYFKDPNTGARWDIWITLDPATGVLSPHRMFHIHDYKGDVLHFADYNHQATRLYYNADYVCTWLNEQLQNHTLVDRMRALATLLNEPVAV